MSMRTCTQNAVQSGRAPQPSCAVSSRGKNACCVATQMERWQARIRELHLSLRLLGSLRRREAMLVMRRRDCCRPSKSITLQAIIVPLKVPGSRTPNALVLVMGMVTGPYRHPSLPRSRINAPLFKRHLRLFHLIAIPMYSSLLSLSEITLAIVFL